METWSSLITIGVIYVSLNVLLSFILERRSLRIARSWLLGSCIFLSVFIIFFHILDMNLTAISIGNVQEAGAVVTNDTQELYYENERSWKVIHNTPHGDITISGECPSKIKSFYFDNKRYFVDCEVN